MRILSTTNQIKKFLGREPMQTISIRVTKGCNLKCIHCYSFSGTKLKNELSTEEIKDLLLQAKELGAMRVFFTGGEPFIRPDICEVLNYADENELAIYISTNGTFIDKKIAHTLKQLKHLRTLQISIDGLKKTHDLIRGVKGTFDKAINSTMLIREAFRNTEKKITFAMTLMEINKNEVIKVYKLAILLGINVFGLIPLYPVKRSEKARDVSTKEKYKICQELCKIYEDKNPDTKLGLLIPPALIPEPLKEVEYGCGYVCAFPGMLGIDANGNVAPCDGLFEYKNFTLGNIRNQPLRKLWNHSLMKRLRKINPKNLTGVCKKCKHLTFCMGGCRARAFIEYGNFKAPHPLCQSFYEEKYFPTNILKNGY